MNVKRNIGRNRGQYRVWIEGQALAVNGWSRGETYERLAIANGFRLTKTAKGKLKVAGTSTRPILDLNGAYVTKALQGFETVSVQIDQTSIIIQGVTS